MYVCMNGTSVQYAYLWYFSFVDFIQLLGSSLQINIIGWEICYAGWLFIPQISATASSKAAIPSCFWGLLLRIPKELLPDLTEQLFKQVYRRCELF